jgi:hypothetical protein
LHDLWLQQIVGVEKNDDIAGALLKTEHVAAQLIGFRPEVSRHFAAETIDNLSRVIGRGIVYDNHFLVWPVDR